jgi:hypothetical protein
LNGIRQLVITDREGEAPDLLLYSGEQLNSITAIEFDHCFSELKCEQDVLHSASASEKYVTFSLDTMRWTQTRAGHDPCLDQCNRCLKWRWVEAHAAEDEDGDAEDGFLCENNGGCCGDREVRGANSIFA